MPIAYNVLEQLHGATGMQRLWPQQTGADRLFLETRVIFRHAVAHDAQPTFQFDTKIELPAGPNRGAVKAILRSAQGFDLPVAVPSGRDKDCVTVNGTGALV